MFQAEASQPSQVNLPELPMAVVEETKMQVVETVEQPMPEEILEQPKVQVRNLEN